MDSDFCSVISRLAEHMSKVHKDNEMLLNKPKCEYKLIIRPESMAS